MASHRTEQVGELIKHELGNIFLREIEFPVGTLVTITRVVVTGDMRQAKVMISVMPFARRFVVLEKIRKNIYDIQGLVNDKLSMKIVPKLAFFIDETEEKASHVEELLDKIAKEQ